MQNFQNLRFEDLFREQKYLALKNYLYNYRLRKRAVGKCLRADRLEKVLEIGSGISPLTKQAGRTVFSDVSVDAIRFLKQHQQKGEYVVADGRYLPFKPEAFSHAVCSEVLEHIEDDRAVLKELKRILKAPSGCLVVTVPHRKGYFSNDDRFVKHHRRYEMTEIKHMLTSMGFKPVKLRKVLGPLEKITMSFAVCMFSILQKPGWSEAEPQKQGRRRAVDFLAPLFEWANLFYQGFVWLDARMMPLPLSTVILIKSVVSARPKRLEHFRNHE